MKSKKGFAHGDFYFVGFENDKIQKIYLRITTSEPVPGRYPKYNNERNCPYVYTEYDGTLRLDRSMKEFHNDKEKVKKMMSDYASRTKKSSIFNIEERHDIGISDKGTLTPEMEIVFSLETPLDLTESNLSQVMEAIMKSYKISLYKVHFSFPDRY